MKIKVSTSISWPKKKIFEKIVISSHVKYAIVADLIAEGVGSTVPNTMRETVTAVWNILTGPNSPQSETTVAAVAKSLNLDHSSAYRRVRAATQKGFLKNMQEKKGQPARIILGDPLPDDQPLLPDVKELAKSMRECDGMQKRFASTKYKENVITVDTYRDDCTIAGETGGHTVLNYSGEFSKGSFDLDEVDRENRDYLFKNYQTMISGEVPM